MRAMRTRRDPKAIAVAGRLRRAAAAANPDRSFSSGLLLGLGAASLFLAGELPRPRAPSSSTDDDWRAIRGDLDAVTSRRGGR